MLCALPMGIQGAERPPQIRSFLATKPTSISPQKTEKKKGGGLFLGGKCANLDDVQVEIWVSSSSPEVSGLLFGREKKIMDWRNFLGWETVGGRYSVFWEMGAVFERRKRHSLRKGEGGRNCEMGFFPGREGRRN